MFSAFSATGSIADAITLLEQLKGILLYSAWLVSSRDLHPFARAKTDFPRFCSFRVAEHPQDIQSHSLSSSIYRSLSNVC